MKDEKTRLFFVVWEEDKNNEIFETLEEADDYAKTLDKPKISVAIVKHAYRDNFTDGKSGWNYGDLADTFRFIISLQ